MVFTLYYFYIFAITSFTGAVKVNMHGSLSLGKEVMDTITHYFRNGHQISSISGRRSMNSNLDLISSRVKSASLCEGLQICTGMINFVDEYVTELARAVEGILEGILNEKAGADLDATTPIFVKLKSCLADVKKILKSANGKITEAREAHVWVGVIKKISGTFQRKSISYITDRLEANDLSLIIIDEIKKKLTQSLVIDIITAEIKALKSICVDHQICINSIECTKSLNTLLSRFRKLPKNKVKDFMKEFYEKLADTGLYSILDSVTAKEFKIILNDMAYSDSVPTVEILNSIQKTVETRLNTLYTYKEPKRGQDIQLVNIILSDMDYLYSKQKEDVFHNSLNNFIKWTKDEYVDVSIPIKFVLRNVENVLYNAPDDITLKIYNEVKVFLEITVDPDN